VKDQIREILRPYTPEYLYVAELVAELVIYSDRDNRDKQQIAKPE
jgi:hypothetical protein